MTKVPAMSEAAFYDRASVHEIVDPAVSEHCSVRSGPAGQHGHRTMLSALPGTSYCGLASDHETKLATMSEVGFCGQ